MGIFLKSKNNSRNELMCVEEILIKRYGKRPIAKARVLINKQVIFILLLCVFLLKRNFFISS